jgi:protein-disulfide isomerase
MRIGNPRDGSGRGTGPEREIDREPVASREHGTGQEHGIGRDPEAGSNGSEARRRRPSRRRFLAAVVASASAAGTAGCLGGLSEAGMQGFADNPVAEGVDDRPRLGPPRAETPITLVSFDDPSCPSCASLHDGAFEAIRSQWVAEGRATVYSRAYYFVREWGRSAVNALLETYERDPAAYWALKGAYYEHQDDIDAGSVVDRTAAFLDGIDTGVDVEAVTTAARERPHRSAVAADDEAGTAAGINGVPTVFVFHRGEFVTTLRDDGFDAYESAVESHA